MLSLTRDVGKLIRGRTTSFGLVSATTLGLAAGLTPWHPAAAGLVVLLWALLALANANLYVAGVAAALGAAAGAAAGGPLAALGQLLLDSPARPAFRVAVNAPVSAWFGLDLPRVTGGLAAAFVIGPLTGLTLVLTLGRVRHALAKREERRARARPAPGDTGPRELPVGVAEAPVSLPPPPAPRSVRLLGWVFFGRRPKRGYREVMARHRRWGNPVRPLGLVGAVGVVAVAGLLVAVTGDRVLTAVAARQLEAAHGATVDLERLGIDWLRGGFTAEGLAAADPEALDRNAFAAERLTGDLDLNALLRRRVVVDRIEVVRAAADTPRATPGRRTTTGPTDDAPASTGGETGFPTSPDVQQIEDLFARAKIWRQRAERAHGVYARVRDALEPILGGGPNPDDAAHGGRGPTATRDAGLRDPHPALLVRRVLIDGVDFGDALPGVRLELADLSTRPAAHPGLPTLRLDDPNLQLHLSLPGGDGNPGALDLTAPNLRVDQIAALLPAGLLGEHVALRGGTATLRAAGFLNPSGLDVPVSLTLRDIELTVDDRTRRVAELPLTLSLVGPPAAPGLRLDRDALTATLIRAGAPDLAREAARKLGDRLKLPAGLGDRISEVFE